MVNFLQGQVAKYWMLSNIWVPKFRVQQVFFVKDLQLLGAESIKLGGHNF